MRVKFCGAAREVTGSAHLITLKDGYTILLDCGLFQGRQKEMANWNANWHFNPKTIDCVILSHGHIDHTGRLPKLYKDGFRGRVYSTHATRSLCSIMLLDSAMIQERDAKYYNKRARKKNRHAEAREALYSQNDVNKVMGKFIGIGYEEWFHVHPKVRVRFRDAGHILGSASITLEIKEGRKTRRIGFSGDIGRPNRPILRDPQPMDEVDYLICESTYGDKEHSAPPAESEQFLKIIRETCVEKQGKLLIPAFSIGRTQEVVHMLDQMETKGLLPKIPVFVDSPLAVSGTEIYGTHPECYDNDLNKYILTDSNPFGFNRLTYNRDLEFSKELNHRKDACIIISASGMMNAGRAKHHLSNSIEYKKNTVLVVGYCSPETPGGKLRAGAEKIRLFGDEKKVNARIEIMDSFSAHADRSELLDFVKNQNRKLRQMFLVHGNYEKQKQFKGYLEKHRFKNIVIPSVGQEFTLD